MTKRTTGAAQAAPATRKRTSGPSLTAAKRRANGLELLQGLWLPAELVARADSERRRQGLSRTALVRRALEEWLVRVLALILVALVALGCGAAPQPECGWVEVATALERSSRVVVYSAVPYPYCGVLPLGVSACEQLPVTAMRAVDGPVSLWRRVDTREECRIEVVGEGY